MTAPHLPPEPTEASEPTAPSLWGRLQASTARPIDILGLGECSQDRVLRLPGRLVDLVPLLQDPSSGGKLRAISQARVGGGQIATALCAASRLGLRSAFAGVVGDDSDGRDILQGLVEEGVDVTPVHVLPGVATRTALIVVDSTGDRLVLEHRDDALRPPDDGRTHALLSRVRSVHVDATFPDAALALLRQAAAHGCIGSLDLDHSSHQALALLRAADLSVLTAGVPSQLTGIADLAPALQHLSQTLRKPLIATQGDRGSLLAWPSEHGVKLHHQPAFPAVPGPTGQLDTTACGDTYRAALLAALLRSDLGDPTPKTSDSPKTPKTSDPFLHGLSRLQAAMRAGSAAAAIKCRDLGRRGCPRSDELREFLKRLAAER